MVGKHADSVLVEGFGIPVVKTIATARQAGITGPILGSGTTATSVNLISQFVPANVRAGYVFVNYTSAVAGTPTAATKLATELKNLAPITEPLFVPMFSYDAVQLMARGWNDASSLDADAASAAIEKVNEKAGTHFFLHDAIYSDRHHEPQVGLDTLTLCTAEALDANGLAKAAA